MAAGTGRTETSVNRTHQENKWGKGIMEQQGLNGVGIEGQGTRGEMGRDN